MRVTQGMISLGVKENLTRRAIRMEQAHKRLSEGMRIYRPSDDPGAVSRVLALRSLLGDVTDRQFQAESGISVLIAADDAMAEADVVMQKAFELAIASGGGLDAFDRKNSIAVQVAELQAELDTAANTLYDDRPLFFAGNNAVGATGVLGLGLSQDAVFGSANAALTALIEELQLGNAASDETMEALKTGLDTLLTYRTQVGARTNRLEAVKNRLIDMEEDLVQRKSAEEEVDIAQAVIDMKEEEVAYQSALAATSRIMQVSLVDFL